MLHQGDAHVRHRTQHDLHKGVCVCGGVHKCVCVGGRAAAGRAWAREVKGAFTLPCPLIN